MPTTSATAACSGSISCEIPEIAERPEVCWRIAALFWSTHGLNELADRGELREITRRINGGYNGWEDRLRYFERSEGVDVLPRLTRKERWERSLATQRERLKRLTAARRTVRGQSGGRADWIRRAYAATKVRINRLKRLIARS